MKAKKVIQEFMDLMKKMLHKSKIEKLQAYLQNLSKMSFNESEVEYLMKAVLQYIDIVINISANKGHRDQIRICNQWMDALQVVITDDVRAVFMKKVTQRIFDFLIEEDINTWCIKKELLRMFLTCVQKSPKEVRNKTAQELPDIYLFKIVDSISTYGDYDFQVILIETVFRLFGKNTILSNLTDLIPESQELTDSFADINGETFDEDVRKFLNILNQNSKKVFSVVCRDVFLGKIKCGEPMDNVGGLWVDFNRSENAVSWYTTAESLNGDDNLDGSNTGWILVLFFVKDVQLVQIYRPPNSNDAIIYVKLKQPCMVSFESSVDCAKAEDVKFVISSDSNRVKALISEVLPAMFKNKLHNHSLKVSLGKKAVYKPLKVSFRRRTRSDSKSDTSSFSALVNAVSGLNNKSCDGSEVHSMSSLSTKCDVISISDGSVHSNESSIDLVPSLRQPSQNVEVERSQYETSEMCTSHYSQEACKISMNRFVSKEHNSNNLSITDGTHNIPGVIRKISGRYSGWKSSLATFTPKKKSCPRLQIEKSSTASGNIVEGNSSDRYETAQGDPQSLFYRQGMTSEDVLDGEELAENERDKLLLLEDVLENEATIPKNKGADLEPKWHDEKFSVSKSSLKSKEQQSKEISLQRNKIESMSQGMEKDQKGNVKDVTRREGDNKNLISFNTKDLFPKGNLIDIGEYVATPLEENEKPNKDIVIDLESDVESLDVSSQEVLPAINKKVAEESQSNISVIKKGNVEPSPMANEIKKTKNNLSFTDGTHNIPGRIKIISGRHSGSNSSLATSTPKKKSCPRLQIEKSSTASGNIVEGNSSDRYETAQGVPQNLFNRQGTTCDNIPGRIKIISGRYSRSKSFPATSISKKISFPIRQVENNNASGNIVGDNSFNRYKTAQGVPQNLFHRQGTTCEDVVNGEKLTQNKRDKLLLLKDVLENDATISKNKEADLKPKQQDEKFLVSKSSLKSGEQKSEERPAGRKVFKEISLESNKIELMSRCKEKDQTRNVKDKTREEDNIENLVLFNTEDLFPKVILTDIEKYAATIMEVNKKPDKDIVIDLESDVENLEVPSLEVLPTVNKTIANQSHLNVSVNKKGNAKEPSSTANENNEKKEGNPVLFNTEDLLPKVILTDIEKYAVTKMEVNKKPDKDIVIDLKSDVENLDVPSQEVLPTVNKTIASQSQSNVFINKKGNAEEPSPMANENNENKEVDALTSSVNRFMPRGRNSDDLPSTDGTHNVLGEIRIISGRYSGSKNSPATSKPKKKKSSPRLQVEKSSTASGDIIKGNSTDCCRQGTTHEDVLNGEELVQNKLDELPSLEDVSENDAIISKNKGADLEPKQQDEKFSVSKSMPKSEKRKRKERLARRKIFKQISPERNKIKLMSQSKNKEQTTNVKDKTRQESDKESLVLINTEDLLPKVILTNIGKYTQKPNKDIVIDLESDVENLNVPSQAVLPTVNKTNARELQSNVSAIKKGNTEGLSPTANEENEKKDDNLSSSDGTHNVSGEIRIISGRYSSSKSSLATSVPNKKLSTRLQVEKSNSATGDIVEGNSCDHYETTQGITQNPSDLQQTTCEDFLNGEELAQNKRDKLLLLEGILDKEATILKKKGADLELKRHDEEFSVSNSSLKSKEQKREGKSAGRKIFKQISPERNKIKLMSQCKDKEQTRNVKDMTRQENDKENLVLFNTEDLFPKVILTNIGKYVEKPNKGIVPSQEVLPAVNEAIVSESQSNVSVIKKENAEKASPMVDEDNEKKEEEIGLNKEADARPALTLIPDQRENLEYARQLSSSTVENNAGENNNDEFIQDRERDFNELRKHHNQTYLSTTLGGTKRRKLYDPNDLTYLENIELFKEKDKETDTVEPSAKPQEKSIRRKVFRKKEVHHKQHKSKKLKVVRPHTTLNVSKHRDNSKLKLTFCEVLDSFRKESKSSFLNILKSTAAGKSVKEKKKVVKASKNNSTKVAKKLRTKPKNILIRNECARDHSVSDNSSASLKLVGEHKCTDDETDLDSLCREKVPYIEPDKKINIISDIQLRPKRTLLQNKSEVHNKKMKNENNPASDIEDDFCIMSKHISNNEICNWIETGSPNYNADISERRTVLKYVYFMSKKALGNPDASQEYQDLLNVCRLLKKYV